MINTKLISVNNIDFLSTVELTEWITKTGELKLISSENSSVLSTDVLHSWFINSIAGVVLCVNDLPIGVATLSKSEIGFLPSDTIECCHLVVHPQWRRLYYGTLIVSFLLSVAKKQGYKRVVGRIVPTNSVAKLLLNSLNFELADTYEDWISPDFVWYQRRFK
jgi:GNAT superfamily N-acetyltransferase